MAARIALQKSGLLNRTFHDPEHHAGNYELVRFRDFNVRVFRVRRTQDHSAFLAQILLDDRFAVNHRDDNVPGAGLLRIIDQKQVSVFRFDDLADLLRRDYRLNQRRSLERAEDAIVHLKSYFGNYRAVDISDHEVDGYVDLRLQGDKIANSTVNYEVALLKRMYRLARMVLGGYRPEFPRIPINNIRKGFFEESEFRALLAQLDEDLRPPVEFAYITGWRMQSEVFPLQWQQVDFQAGEVRLGCSLEMAPKSPNCANNCARDKPTATICSKDRTEHAVGIGRQGGQGLGGGFVYPAHLFPGEESCQDNSRTVILWGEGDGGRPGS